MLDSEDDEVCEKGEQRDERGFYLSRDESNLVERFRGRKAFERQSIQRATATRPSPLALRRDAARCLLRQIFSPHDANAIEAIDDTPLERRFAEDRGEV